MRLVITGILKNVKIQTALIAFPPLLANTIIVLGELNHKW